MAIEDTGGGAHVGGNVDAGRNFTGRDSSTDNSHENHFNFKLGNGDSYRSREHLSLEDRIRDVELYLYGDKRVGEPGLIAQTRSRLLWRQIDTALLTVILLMVAKIVWG